MDKVMVSLEECYRVADELPAEQATARNAISFAGYTAQMYRRNVKALAWACAQSNAKKRNAALQSVLAELEANGESIADLPLRERA